jgi:hypothetical protein
MSNFVPKLISEIEACHREMKLLQLLCAVYDEQLNLAVESLKLACAFRKAAPPVQEAWTKFESGRPRPEIAIVLHRLMAGNNSITDFVHALQQAGTTEGALAALAAGRIHVRGTDTSRN